MKDNPALGDWEELQKELFTPEELAESDLRVAVILALLDARQEKGITRKELERMTGIKRPVIAGMERGFTNPRINTVLKLLAPLGKTLAVVPLDPK